MPARQARGPRGLARGRAGLRGTHADRGAERLRRVVNISELCLITLTPYHYAARTVVSTL